MTKKGKIVSAFALSLLLPGFLSSRVSSVLVDAMDTTVGYAGEADSSAPAHAVLVSGSENQAVQLKFNFTGSSTYSQAVRNFQLANLGELFWSGSRLRFFYRGSGPANTLLFRLTETDGDKASYRDANPTLNSTWVKVELTRSSFTVTQEGGGDGKFDFFRVKTVEITMEKTGSGGAAVLDVDKIEIVRDAVSNIGLLLDNFNGGSGTANSLAGSTGAFVGSNSTPSASLISATYDGSSGNVYEGAYALKLNFDFSGTTQTVIGYYTSPNGANLSTYRQVEFFAKASNDNEAFELAMGSTAVQQTVKVGGIGTNWSKVTVDFQNFDQVLREGAAFNPTTEFVIRFIKNLSSDSGALWIDNIRFVRPALTEGPVKTVDQFEEPTTPELTSWSKNAEASTLSSIADGYDGRALRLNYNLNNGTYAGLYRNMDINAGLTDGIRFQYFYNGSVANDLQFNVLDSDGVRFYRTVKGVTSTGGQWKSMALPFSSFVKDSTNNLNLRKLKDIRITLLKDKGGKGGLALDNLEVLNVPKVQLGDPTRLIRLLTVDNNPFSPNGDGLKDKSTLSYTIAENAYIRLRIYDVNGGVLKEFKFADAQPAGENTIVWDGTDEGHARVPNGLYFFQLNAESAVSGTQDKETSVIAVLR